MDYFLELLKSYDKLKKRKFKLTYITEAQDKKKKPDNGKSTQEDMDAQNNKNAEALALEVVKAGPQQPFNDEYKRGGQPPYAYFSKTKQEVQLMGGPMGSRAGRVADAAGNPDVSSDAWKKLVNFFKDGKDDELLRQQEDEILLQQRLDTLGSLVESDPERFPELAQDIVALEKENNQQIDELCRKQVLPIHICKGDLNTLQYIGGSNAKSLESKLFNGTGFIGFDENGKMVREQIGEGVFADTFQTNLQLLELLEKGKPDCEQVNKRMGLVGKGKVVLFTDPDGQAGPMELGEGGVVVDKGGLHQTMIDIFTKSGCTIESYEFKGSTNSLNETKGRFNEHFMGLITRVYSAVRGNPGATPKEKSDLLKPILDGFEQDMKSTLASLQEFAGQTPMADQGIVLESYPLMEEIHSELQSLTEKEGVKNLISQMYVQMGGLLKELQADNIIAGGTAQRLGGKVDNFFVYTGDDGLARAQQNAGSLGLLPEDVVTRTPAELYNNATEALKPEIEKTLTRQGFPADTWEEVIPNPDLEEFIPNPKYKEGSDADEEIPNPKYNPDAPETLPNPNYTPVELHLLSAGNKLSVGNQIKFGDLSLNRAIEIAMGNPITGSSPPENEDAWYSKLDESLGFTAAETGRISNPVLEQPETIPNPDAPEEVIPNPDYDPTAPATVRGEEGGSLATYFGSIQKMYKACDTISQQAQYTGTDGQITLTNPSQVALQLQSVALGNFEYGGEGSNFYNACTREIPNPHGDDPKTIRERKLLDGDTPEAKGNRKKASEALKRDYLSYRLRTDYMGNNPVKKAGATDALCRMAGATIMEMSEMGQIVTEEAVGAEPLVINQNDILRGLGKARKSKDLLIEFEGSTQHLTFKVKGQDGKTHEITYSTNLERQKDRPAMTGHIKKEAAAKVGRRIDPLQPRVKEDTLYQFLQGQMSLLEKILNQPKRSQVL